MSDILFTNKSKGQFYKGELTWDKKALKKGSLEVEITFRKDKMEKTWERIKVKLPITEKDTFI